MALGKVDYYEVLGFSEHRTSAAIWYRLLNCGFRPSAAAGTDAMANFASLRGPVGMNRVYALTESAGGSDAVALQTRAVRDGDTYVLDGAKAFITGAGDADLYIVMARTGAGSRGVSAAGRSRSWPTGSASRM